ncbi:MAG: cytochrome C oxidase subunit IV family protein [Bacteroidetes bacterium]|nr:cytochrome C oxidase subunit IV family protein [Bacteroidota bacterium]
MSSHNHNDSIQHLYEGDQSKLYSGLMAHHTDINSPESKKQVGRIWKVFWILLVVTIVEVMLGMYSYELGISRAIINSVFLILTLFKASYIVAVFMHLGDELKNFMITVLMPLVLFIWFIIAFLADGGFWLHMNTTSPVR